MKIGLPALAAVLLAGLSWSAQAQGLPQGSYLRSCNGARMEGDTLVARCRAADGREQRTALAQVRRCTGDIANMNGVLQCAAGGGVMRGQVMEQPGFGGPPGAPGYGAPGYGGPGSGPPGYGDRRYGERENIERCRELRRETEELRFRLDREFNPIERARTEGRLRELREHEARCR